MTSLILRQGKLILLLLLMTTMANAQKSSGNFQISGRVRLDNGDPAGTLITLTNLATKTQLATATVNSTGKFDLEMKFSAEYKMTVAKEGYYTKEIEVSTIIPAQVWAKDSIFPPYPMVVTIYKKVPDVKLNFEGKIIGKLCYSPKGKLDNMDADIYIDDKEIRREIDQAMKEKEDEIFNRKMAEAVEFEKKNQVREAIKAYEEALALRKNDQFIRPKLKELNSDLQSLEKDALLDKQFNGLLETGDQNVARKAYPEAIDNFKAALTIKPGNPVASEKLSNAEKLLNELNAGKARQEAEFERLLAAGDDQVVSRKYKEAIENFKSALVIHPGHKVAQNKLTNAEQLLAREIADRQKMDAEFNKWIAAGDDNVAQTKYQDAIANFQKALTIKVGDKIATDKLSNAERLFARMMADKQKLESEYKARMASGENNIVAQKYTDAIGDFKGALVLKPGDKPATDKIAAVEQMIARRESENKKLEDEFNRLIIAGDAHVQGANFADAIVDFNSALKIKPNDANAKEKLSAAEQQLARLNAEKTKQEEEYNRLLTLGDQKVGVQKYTEAIEHFKGALVIKPGDKNATLKLATAEQLLARQNADKEKLETQFRNWLASGDQNVSVRKFPEAIENFKSALNLKPEDPTATQKLTNAERLLAELNAERTRLDEEFDRLLAAGDQSLGLQKYAEAIDSYKKALVIKVADKTATSRLANAEQMLARQIADKARLDADFNRLLVQGDQNVSSLKYVAAIDNYKEALTIKPGEKSALEKLANAEQLLARANADKAKLEEEFNRHLAEGDKYVSDRKYEQAITSFKNALQVKPADKVATSKLSEAQQLLDKEMAEKSRLEGEFNRLLVLGDQNVIRQLYPAAVENYKEALTIKPGEKSALEKLAKLEELMTRLKSEQEKKDTEFNKLISAGDQNVGAQQYPAAIENFKGALVIKPGDNTAIVKLANAEQLLTKQNAQKAQQEAEFNRLIADGDLNVSLQKYSDAIINFKGALQIKPEDKPAKDRLASAEQSLLKQSADKAKMEAEFNRLLALGDENVAAEKFPEAIEIYKEALRIKPGDKLAIEKLAKAGQLLEALNAKRAASEAEFKRLLASGDLSVSVQKYAQGIEQFIAALVIKPKDKIAELKLANANDLLAKENAEKVRQEEEFRRLIKEGDDQVAEKRYPAAIDLFKDALKIRPGDKEATSKLTAAENLLAGLNAENARLEAEFNKYLVEGDLAVSARKYADGIVSFKKALAMKPANKIALSKLSIAEELLSQEAAERARLEAEFNRHYAAGISSVASGKYTEGIVSFKAALGIRPGDKEVTAHLIEAEKLLAQLEAEKQRKISEQQLQAEKQRKYREAIYHADQLFDSKSYPDSRFHYVEATKIFDFERHHKERITEIDSLMARADRERALLKQKAADQRKLQDEGSYMKNVQSGDASFAKSQWTIAIYYYQEALKYKAGDAYALERIESCGKMIAGNITAERMVDYTEYLKHADEEMAANRYSSARFYYKKAIGILPWEKYPKNQISSIEKLISTSGMTETDAEYFEVIRKGEEAMAQKNFAVARFYFQRALSLKPGEEYPAQELKRISSEN